MKVAVLGTCRVHDPLHSIPKDSGISILTPQNTSYLHTSAEALQRLHYHLGSYDYPDYLEKYQIGKGEIALSNTKSIDDADFVLIEISSVKLLTFEDHFLQFNHTVNRIRKMGPDFSQHWLQLMDGSFSSGEPIPEILDFPESISNFERQIISKIKTKKQPYEELEEDLEKISNLLGSRVLIVTHVAARKKNGKIIKSRENLIKRISESCYKFDIPVINPTEFLEVFGQEKMMAKDGEDTNHYDPKVLSQIGEKMFDKIVHSKC